VGGFYLPRDGWFIYFDQGFHGQFLFRVPRSAVVADFQNVLGLIRKADTNGAPLRLRLAAAVMGRNHSVDGDSPETFVSLLRTEHLNHIKTRFPDSYQVAISEEQEFSLRWGQARRFWVNILAESAFFASLIIFALWPWPRRKGPRAWGIHFGALPLLLMLPYCSGYADWTFSSAGPSGGISYPLAIAWSRDFPVWTSADEWVLLHFPKVLWPLSQSLGPMLSVSGGHGLGPFTASLSGGMIAIAIPSVVVLARRTGFLRAGGAAD
jgi:hypothetical protein